MDKRKLNKGTKGNNGGRPSKAEEQNLIEKLSPLEEQAFLKLSEAIHKVFKRRNTHPIPQKLEKPPKEWEKPFNDLVKTCGMNISISEGFQIIHDYFNILWQK